MMLVKVPDATCYHFDAPFDFITIQIDEKSAVSQMIRRYWAKKLTIIVVFVISVDSALVKPAEIINYFNN